MRRAIYAAPGQRAAEVGTEEELARLVAEGKGCLWVDFEAPNEEDKRVLRTLFKFHRLAIEDALAHTHHPRLHDYGEYVYLVVHSILHPLGQEISPPAEGELARPKADTAEIDVFLGGNFLVTWHDALVPTIGAVWKKAIDVPSLTARGPDRLLAELLDEVAEGYVDLVERLNESVDHLETRLFQRQGATALRAIFALKKDVVHLRRVLGPQREVVNRLARAEFQVVSKEETLFFRDVYDHVYRTTEMLESLRDVLTSALEVYLTLMANRTNEIMKVLTIFSVVIMSASLVAGVYGMNVDLPRVGGHGDFFVLLLLMGLIAGVSILWFKRRRWI